jgi:arylsulfatase A-like enzyme
MKSVFQWLVWSALALFAGGAASVSSAAERRPNVLIIVADDLGYGELGSQSFTSEIPTPHLDSIARNGVRFTSGYVSGPYCSPTRAGLLTGRYQQRFGHELNPSTAQRTPPNVGLPVSETTLGDRFKAAGYKTGWIGKSHLGYAPQFHPLKRGFDEFFGFLGGMHDFLDADADPANPILRGTERITSIDYLTDALGREASAFIDKHKASPWLCYLAFNAVHAPLQATEKYLDRFAHIADPKRRAYAALQSAMDDAVGVVLAKLREHGLERDTLVVFFSDNGGPTPSTTSGNGPLRGFKSQTWEGGIRVPFMMQWPGTIPAGKVDDRPVIQLDVLPTALAAAGIKAKPEWKLDGVNLLPFLTGKNSASPHEVLYWRFGPQLALRMGDWKILKAPGAGVSAENPRDGQASTVGVHLYNLRQDLGEKVDLAATHPEKLRELVAAWERINREMIDPLWRDGAAERGTANKAGKKASPE